MPRAARPTAARAPRGVGALAALALLARPAACDSLVSAPAPAPAPAQLPESEPTIALVPAFAFVQARAPKGAFAPTPSAPSPSGGAAAALGHAGPTPAPAASSEAQSLLMRKEAPPQELSTRGASEVGEVVHSSSQQGRIPLGEAEAELERASLEAALARKGAPPPPPPPPPPPARRRRTPVAADCKYAGWEDWSECDCSTKRMTRHRGIDSEAKGTGKKCEEEQQEKEEACPLTMCTTTTTTTMMKKSNAFRGGGAWRAARALALAALGAAAAPSGRAPAS